MKNAKMSTKVKNLLLTKYGLNKKISWKQLHETICEVHNIDSNDRANRGYWSVPITDKEGALYRPTKDSNLYIKATGTWYLPKLPFSIKLRMKADYYELCLAE